MYTTTQTEIKADNFTTRFYMTPDYLSYEEFVEQCKNKFRLKVQSVMDFISVEMNAKLRFQSNEFVDRLIDILEIALMQIRFKKEVVDGHTFCLATCNGILSFECNEFDFKFDDSYSFFYAVLNEQLELTSLEYSSLYFGDIEKKLNLKFDHSGNLTEYSNTIKSSVLNFSATKFKSKEMLCPYDDELFLHNAASKRTDLMRELFPELSVDGAYDYASDDFGRRLTLYNMSLI